MKLHKASYLTVEQVRQIKWDLKYSTLTQMQIAKKYDVSQPHISNIKTGKQWAEVELDN